MAVYHQAPLEEPAPAPATSPPAAPPAAETRPVTVPTRVEPASAWTEARELPADRLLVLLGGAGSMLFGLLSFALAASDGRAFAPQGPFGSGGQVLALVVALAFGLLLLHALTMMQRRPAEGAVLGIAFGLVLVIFGGAGGMIGGILALSGAALALARNLKWA